MPETEFLHGREVLRSQLPHIYCQHKYGTSPRDAPHRVVMAIGLEATGSDAQRYVSLSHRCLCGTVAFLQKRKSKNLKEKANSSKWCTQKNIFSDNKIWDLIWDSQSPHNRKTWIWLYHHNPLATTLRWGIQKHVLPFYHAVGQVLGALNTPPRLDKSGLKNLICRELGICNNIYLLLCPRVMG